MEGRYCTAETWPDIWARFRFMVAAWLLMPVVALIPDTMTKLRLCEAFLDLHDRYYPRQSDH